jgi:hypothetical protein
LAGSASITTTSLATGTDHLFASYTPTVTSFQSSESASITQTVLAATTVTLTNSPTSPVYGQLVTLTATVKSTSGTPSGNIEFIDTYFGTSGLLGTVNLNGNGVAALTTSALQGGSNSLTAVYSGDAGHGGSVSPADVITASAAATSTALKSSVSTAKKGQTVTLTATVTSTAGTPPGEVIFKANGTTVGYGTLSNGVAMLQTISLPTGSNSVTATYGGTYSFAGSTSPPVAVSVSNAAAAPAQLDR